MDVDAYDGVYVAGWFYQTFSVGDTSVTGTTGSYDAFLVKFDTNGNFKWIKTQTGSGETKPIGMAVDDDGDVYVQLGFTGSFTAGSSSIASTATSASYWNNAIIKYDSAGNYQWKTHIEGDHYRYYSWYLRYSGGVDIDGSGNPYCTGTFRDTDTLEIGSTTLLSNGVYDAYLAKFNPSTGAPTWAVKGGGTSWEYGSGLTIDESDRIFISGYNYSTNSSFGSVSLNSSGPYWMRYNTSGSAQAGMVGAGVCYSNRVETDVDGNLYMTGLISTNINLSLGGLSATNPTGSSYTPYYFKYDYLNTSSEYLMMPTASSSTEYHTSFVAYDEDKVFVSGSHLGTVEFGDEELTATSYDGFLTRIANCDLLMANASSIGGDSVCSGETTTLEADTNSLYDYQWLYNGAVISGEINPTYTTGTAGSYSVIVDSIGCKDTSDAIVITVNALPTVTHSNFPNVCDGDDPFTLSGGTPSGGVYSGTGVTGGNTFDPDAAATGNNIITYTYTDANGCVDSVDKTITVQTSPAIFTTTISACEDDSPVSLSASAYGYPTGGTHSGTGVSSNSFNPTTAGAGTHTIFYSSSNGCVSPDSIVATVTAAPNVSLGSYSNLCATNTTPVTLTGGTPTGGTYSGGSYIIGGFFYTLFSGSGTHNVIYTVTSSGCSASDTSTITVDPAANSSISTLPDLCEDEDTLGLVSYGTPSGGTFTGTGVTSNVFNPATSGIGTFTLTYSVTNACGTATDTESISVNDLPTITITPTNVSCNGGATGQATAAGSGTATPYSYSWSTGGSSATVTGLSAVTYTVTVTDNNGCEDEESVTISEPSALSVSTTTSNASCNGGNDGIASAFASGGTTSYTYSWNTGGTSSIVTGLTAGAYTLTVTDANGCTETATAVVTDPTAVSASITGTDASCNGATDGSATASATGGTGTKTFAWSNSGTGATITGLAAGTYTVTATDANGCTDTESVTIDEPAAVVASTTVDEDVSCNGGSDGEATASATGGTTAYTYAWSNSATTASITGLAAGTYTVTVTDANGCTDTETVSISEPATSVAVSIAGTDASCNGASDGAATATGTGGTGTITYAWSNSGTGATVTGLAAGTYTVTATDANGCTDTESVTIDEPTAVSASISGTDASCNGATDGSATVSATGGTGTITYAWSNSGTGATITGLAAGTYTVTATDANGCTDTESVTIDEPTAVSASISGTDASCNGATDGSATASATGGTGTKTFAWSNSGTGATITGLAAGTYTVTATDANGCTDTESVTIDEPAAVVASTTVDEDVSCNGGSDGEATASATGGTTAYTYAWSNSATTASITGLAAGTYTVTVTDANGCTDTETVSISEPASGVIAAAVLDSNVSCNSGSDGGATASATGGTAGYTYSWSNSATTASITGIAAGTYSVTVTDANGCTDSTSVIVTEPTSLVAASVLDSNTSCNGSSNGGATASATGGTGTYSYSWSNSATTASITGVPAGTYSVTVTDANGCTDSSTVTITEPNSIVATSVVDSNVSCNGSSNGGATAGATGGTGTYTYAWSNSATTASITGVLAGTYSVTVTDANGCTDSASVTVTEPTSLVAATSLDSNVSCNGNADGGATVSATGGTTAYSYAWSNSATTASITGVAAATYSVTITDVNGCTDSSSVIITEPTVLVATATVDSNTSCSSASTGVGSAVGSGGITPYLYEWSNGADTATANNLASGWHYVTVSDANNCTAIDSIEVDVQDTIAPTVIIQSVTVFLDASGSASIDTSDVNNGSFDNCAIDTMYLSNVNFDCSDTGSNTVTLYVADINGNPDSATSTVTVIDTTAPTISVNNVFTLYLNTSGSAAISINSINDGTNDNCGIESLSLSDSLFDCSDTGSLSITFTATDFSGNVDTGSISITVLDTILPNVATQNLTVYLNSSGFASVTAAMVNNGSFDNCSIDTMVLSDTSFNCSAVGGNSVVLYVWDASGNIDSAGAIITVVDSVPVELNTYSSIDVYLNSTGFFELDTSMFDSASTDNCGIATMTLSQDTVWCADVPSTNVTLTATDAYGNISTSNVIVNVFDTISPTVSAIDTMGYLNTNGQFVITAAMLNDGTMDACGIDSMWLSQSIFSCADIGVDTIWFYAADENGNVDSTQSEIAIVDSISTVDIAIDSNLLCFGATNGQLTASASGMVSTFTYSWSNSSIGATISNLSGDTYIVTSTDANGCTAIDSATLVDQTELVGSLSAMDLSCFGANDGSIASSVSGGTLGYTYNWSNSATTDSIGGLSGGLYDLTVTDTNGCELILDTTLSEPTLLVVNISFADSSLCVNDSSGMAMANVSGGTPGYSYLWSGSIDTIDSITGIPSGTYSVIVTDTNECVASDTQTIAQDTLPVVTLNIPEDSLCQFNSITLTGQTPFGGMFSGAGVMADTLVTETLTEWNWVQYTYMDANGCSGAAEDSIYVTPTINVSFDMNSVELCGGTSIPLDFANPGGGVYGGIASIIDTANGMLIAPDSAFTGNAWYGYSNVCGSDTDTFSMVVFDRPDVDLGGDVTLCNASMLTLDAGAHNSTMWFDGTTSQTITLNDGEEPLMDDFNLWVTVGDTNGCSDSDTILVKVEDQPIIYLGNNIDACIKDSVVLSVDDVYDNFTWSTGDVGLTTVAHDGTSIIPGMYSFWVKGSNDDGECSYSDTILVQLNDCDSSFVGINDPVLTEVSFEVYPTPTQGNLNIRGIQLGDVGVDRIVIMSMRGEIAQVMNASDWSEISSDEMQINLSALADGVYMMRIDHAQGSNVVRVIVGK